MVLLSLGCYSLYSLTRHRLFIQNYAHHYGGAGMQDIINSQRNFKTDWDVLREEHQFLRDTSEDTEEGKAALSWEKKMAKKYYDKLFKEYAIVDLRFYKEGKCGMRWRTQQEVRCLPAARKVFGLK